MGLSSWIYCTLLQSRDHVIFYYPIPGDHYGDLHVENTV